VFYRRYFDNNRYEESDETALKVESPGTYLVEDVFLIHVDGRLIAHESRQFRQEIDEDIFSGMLTVVQDFIRDSFRHRSETGIKRLDFGQSKILIERSQHCYLTAVVLGSVVSPVLGDLRAEVRRPRLGDTLLVAISAGLAFGLVAILSPVVAGALLLGAVLLVPAWRRWFAGRAERMLLSDLREQARLDAAEAERAHLARELHDVPLQQLAGIIRRLELLPEARAESDELRTVAEQLRGVATELRPPVLDDLGLAPALEFLAEAASTDEVAVVAEVGDRTCLEAGGRPPPTVELAVFRVAQEAVTNALRHAAPTQVRLAGEVAADRVTLAIIDDGRGLDEAEARAAGRRGRLGLASMRRRAEAIEAELDIHGSEKGTRVAIRWTR